MAYLSTRQLAIFSILAATCVALQLSPRIGNVEFTSIITFTMGVFFGGVIGGLFGAMVMFINGFLSPWGVAGFVLPFQMVGMAIMGIAGKFYAVIGTEESSRRLLAESAVLGAFLTLIYDVITNVGVAIQAQEAFLPVFLFGVPMSLLHVISNTAFFGFAFTPLSKVLRSVFWK